MWQHYPWMSINTLGIAFFAYELQWSYVAFFFVAGCINLFLRHLEPAA